MSMSPMSGSPRGGLAKILQGLADETLNRLSLSMDSSAKREVKDAIQRGVGAVNQGVVDETTATNLFRRVIDAAVDEAQRRQVRTIGTEVVVAVKANTDLCPNVFCPDKKP
jgi:hypothetical protein